MYDAYGNVEYKNTGTDIDDAILAAFITAFNPLLYRGYAYAIVGDGICYYLGSRFYMPQLGRFLNADKHTDTDTGVTGTNMYAYCNNNPVMNIDPTGTIPISLIAITGTVTLGILLAFGSYNSMLCLRLWLWSITHRVPERVYDFSSKSKGADWSSFISNKLKNSTALAGVIASIIYYELDDKKSATITYTSKTQATNPPSAVFPWDFYAYGSNPSFNDLDLSWSFGGFTGSFTVKVEQLTKKKYKVTCVLKGEDWNFEEWDNDTKHTDHSFTTIINNLGSLAEDKGATIPFTWQFTVSFNIKI